MSDLPILDSAPDFVVVDGVVYAWGHRADGTYGLLKFPGNGEVPQPPPSNGEQGEVFYVVPVWEVGTYKPEEGHEHPDIGNGELIAWYTEEVFTNATKINLSVYLHLKNGNPGKTDGSYELILPDSITPDLDWYSESFNLWMSGSGQKEFTGSAKWHKTDKTENPIRIIFTLEGIEWSPTEPRPYLAGEGCKLRLTGFEYLL